MDLHAGADQPLDQSSIVPPLVVDEFAVAKAIGMSVSFLRKDRATRRLIPFYRIGNCIRYNVGRVEEALAALEQGGQPVPRGRLKKAR